MRLYKDYKAFVGAGGLEKKLATIFLNPNFHSVCLFRLANLFYRMHLSIISKILWYINRMLFHVDIDYRADLAGGFVLVHGLGTVIGKTVISKGPLTVYQHVTIGGGNGKPSRFDSDGIKRGVPMFMGKTVIYTGAIVVGGIIVSENSIIKAGRVVSEDI